MWRRFKRGGKYHSATLRPNGWWETDCGKYFRCKKPEEIPMAHLIAPEVCPGCVAHYLHITADPTPRRNDGNN